MARREFRAPLSSRLVTDFMQEIPSSFYYLIGSLIVANIGTIGTLGVIAFKATWWLSRLDTRVEKAQETAVRAHKRLDKIEASK